MRHQTFLSHSTCKLQLESSAKQQGCNKGAVLFAHMALWNVYCILYTFFRKYPDTSKNVALEVKTWGKKVLSTVSSDLIYGFDDR